MATLQQTPIEQFKLPGKLIRILHRNDIDTFGELQEVVNRGHLLRLRHVGEKIAAELTQLAAQPELYLAPENQNDGKGGETAPQAQNESDPLIQLDGVHVEKLGLHSKITHALTRAGICTIGELLLIEPSQLTKINRIGLKSARKIQIALDQALNSPEDYIK